MHRRCVNLGSGGIIKWPLTTDFKAKGYDVEEALLQLAPLMKEHGSDYLNSVRHQSKNLHTETVAETDWVELQKIKFMNDLGDVVGVSYALRSLKAERP